MTLPVLLKMEPNVRKQLRFIISFKLKVSKLGARSEDAIFRSIETARKKKKKMIVHIMRIRKSTKDQACFYTRFKLVLVWKTTKGISRVRRVPASEILGGISSVYKEVRAQTPRHPAHNKGVSDRLEKGTGGGTRTGQ